MSQIKTARSVTAKAEHKLLEEWVADVMAHYIKVGDPILKLGYTTVKRMVKERLQRVCITEDNKRRELFDKGIVKQVASASPRASIPVKNAKRPPRQIIAKVPERDLKLSRGKND